MQKTILYLILNVLVLYGLQAQKTNRQFRSFSVNEGLSQSTVYKIYQDSKGFMWFGTRAGGLNKYDGYSFKIYKNDMDDSCSISGNVILDIFEDSKGNIWVSTRKDGLNRFDPETECFFRYYNDSTNDKSLINDVINIIYEDQNGQLWLGANSGLCKYNYETDNFTEVTNNIDRSMFGQILDFSDGPDGNFYIATKDRGLYLFNPIKKEVLQHYQHSMDNPYGINDNSITCLLYDSKNVLWIGMRNKGISKLNNTQDQSFTSYLADNNDSTSLSSNIIRTLHEDKNGSIWIGSKEGIDVLDRGQMNSHQPIFEHIRKVENDNNSLNQNSIYSFFEDNKGDYWIGTWSGGVNYLNNGDRKFEHYRHILDDLTSLSYDVVSSFIKTDDGVWIGTEGGGLNLFNSETGNFVHFKQRLNDSTRLQSDHIKALYVDKDGDLWVGTFNGLYLYNKENDQYIQYFKGASVYSIEGGMDDEVWVGTSKKLYKLNKSDNSVKSFMPEAGNDHSISHHVINTILKDKNNGIWIGTQIGLNYYDRENNQFNRYLKVRNDRNSISHNHITSLCQDLEGNIWIGTFDGLNKFDASINGFQHFGTKNGLPDNTFNNIVCDNQGFLWATTNKGLSKFIPDTTLVKDKTILDNNNRVIRNYEIGDGLQGNEFIMGASYISQNGELFFGGANGFNSFFPESMKDNKQKPEVELTALKIFNEKAEIGAKDSPLSKHISYTQSIKFNHKQSVITFEYVALNFTAPEKNEYAYMMEGFDEDWNYVENKREASYTNLPAGEYTFKVKASNNDGYWNNEGTSISIIVRPPWWKTIVFYLIMIILISFATYSFIKRREDQIKKDKERLEKELKVGKAEIVMQQQKVKEHEEKLMLRDQQEQEIRFMNGGVTRFSELLASGIDNLHLLSQSIILELVNYVGGIMGVLYISVDDVETVEYLELYGSYAFDNTLMEDKKVHIGQGYVGTCFKEKKIIIIDSVPSSYCKLVSGLGEVTPNYVYLIPMMMGTNVQGVIEIACLDKLEDYKIQFIEKIGENITSVVEIRKTSERINLLLQHSQEQTEELRAQEEEVRQNLEEMHATQEELERQINEHKQVELENMELKKAIKKLNAK